MEQSNPGLRQHDSPRRIQVSGMEGRSVTLSGSSPIEQNGRPLSERDWLVTLPDSHGGLLYLIFIAREKDFGQLRPTFERRLITVPVRCSARSLSTPSLTDADYSDFWVLPPS